MSAVSPEAKQRARDRSAKWRAENRGRHRGYAKRWRAENPERAAELARRYAKKNQAKIRKKAALYRSKNRERIRTQQREYRAQSYGLTLAEYDAVLASPCGICGREERPVHLDHCHETGKVRGGLCGPCNRALGILGDDLEGIGRVVAYLQGQSVGNQ